VKLWGLLPARRHFAAAALTAVLLFLAYPPFSLVVPSFLTLVPFLWMLEEAVGAPEYRRTDVLRLGYWFGALANGLVLYWIFIALWHFTPLSLAGYLAAILIILAPGWLLLAWGHVWIRRRTGLPVWLVFPILWTALEWIVGHLGDLRFPWLGLGTSLVRVPTMVQWAELGGARGVTLWLAWVNVLVYLALARRTWRPAALAAATAAMALGYGVWRERTIVTRPVTTVAVLQPNVAFSEKWDRRIADSLMQQLIQLTVRAAELPGVRLVAWPEAAAPGFFERRPDWESAVRHVVAERRIPVLAGGLDERYYSDGSRDYYNAAFLFDSTGDRLAQPSYRKVYLVPITERVPFVPPRWFRGIQFIGGFGKGDRFPVYEIAEGRFGVVICYESAFEDLPRRYRREGADFLLNITNDAWFGRTVAVHQHAAHLVMRAIETRMGVARAANTGISQFVDPLGRTHLSTPLDVERVEASPVLTTSVLTPYVRLGDWVAALALAGTVALLAAAFLRPRSQGVS
jgi:apolipoprotein N-acyltransferase